MLGEFSITASWERPRDIGREWIPRQSSDLGPLLDVAENLFYYAFGDRSGGLAFRLHSIKPGEPDRDTEVRQTKAALRHKATSAFDPAGSPPNLGSR